MSLLAMDNPVFRMYMGYAGVVLCKTLLMAPVTAYYRITRKVFGNPEDAVTLPGAKVSYVNEDVERVRRCHQNDLENVLIFVALGALYTATGPTVDSAALHFRLFAGSRLLHSVVYLGGVRQPARGLCFLTGLFTCFSMGYQVISQAAF